MNANITHKLYHYAVIEKYGFALQILIKMTPDVKEY